MLTTSQSKIAKTNLLPGKKNPVMQDNTSPSSPQWVHMELSIHPLPLRWPKQEIKTFGAYKNSLKFSHKWL